MTHDWSYPIDEWDEQIPSPQAKLLPSVLAEDGLDWSSYHVEDGQVSAIRLVLTESQPLGIRASEFRTYGPQHRARIEVWWGKIRLSWANLNLDDPTERRKLGEAAWASLHPSLMLIYSRSQLVRDLDHFCFGLWDAWAQSSPPEPIARTRTAPPPAWERDKPGA